MNSPPTLVAVGVFAGLLATSVATAAVKVRRWERDLARRWDAFQQQGVANSREVTIDLPPDQPLQVDYLVKQAPIFYVHHT
jgi:hypothetical protein